jgi:hypothetical protein|nr:MAG TPA: hypothetical protein [Myoviridae sp. ctTS62]
MKSLGLDIGYGDVKVVIGDGNQITHIFKYSSAIARAQKVSSIRDPRIVEVNLPSGELDQVYVGPDALSLPSNMIVDIRDYQMLEAYAPAFIAKALETAEVSAGEIDVMVCGLSVAQLGMSGYFKERIKQFTVSGKEYKFDKIFLLPQGAGSKLAFDMFGDHYPQPRTTNTSETYVGGDIGFNTLDMFYVTDGKTSPNLFEGVENAGVIKIAQNLQAVVKEQYSKEITLREAKEILDSGFYKLRGQRFDMQDAITKACDDYTKDILALIEGRYGNVIDKCDFVCLLGGGASILKSSDPFFKIVRNKSEFYNAIGFYLYGVRQF